MNKEEEAENNNIVINSLNKNEDNSMSDQKDNIKNNNKEKIVIFDDGSLAFQLLEKEESAKENQILEKIKAKDLEDFIEKVPKPKKDDEFIKVFLHHPMEQCCQEGIYDKLNEYRTKYPNLRVWIKYGSAAQYKIEAQAKGYGFKDVSK